MEKSLKNSLRSNSHRADSVATRLSKLTAAGTLLVAVVFSGAVNAQTPPPAKKAKASAAPQAKPATKAVETYKDIIAKAQNLTLQRDRLQASQVLLRSIERETKTSVAYKELTKALEELTAVFYTERAQAAFVAGESLAWDKTKEAIESFQEALKLEDSNVATLKALARSYLVLGDCDRAEGYLKSAEALNPYSQEIVLLRLQTLSCAKNSAALAPKLLTLSSDLGPLEKFARPIQLRELVAKKDLVSAKALVNSWEAEAPDYPEVYYWKWELSRLSPLPDRTAAMKYTQLCQNLTPRKRKSYNFDVDLCKGKAAVDEFLKASSLQDLPAGER